MSGTEHLIGKYILVGLTYLRPDGEVREQLQLHGAIRSVNGQIIEFLRSDGEGSFTIPFGGELESGEPGAIYTLRSTGEQVSNVDYLASFTIHPPRD